jgi:hypothetical protein
VTPGGSAEVVCDVRLQPGQKESHTSDAWDNIEAGGVGAGKLQDSCRYLRPALQKEVYDANRNCSNPH